jgi:hypothetical protein
LNNDLKKLTDRIEAKYGPPRTQKSDEEYEAKQDQLGREIFFTTVQNWLKDFVGCLNRGKMAYLALSVDCSESFVNIVSTEPDLYAYVVFDAARQTVNFRLKSKLKTELSNEFVFVGSYDKTGVYLVETSQAGKTPRQFTHGEAVRDFVAKALFPNAEFGD